MAVAYDEAPGAGSRRRAAAGCPPARAPRLGVDGGPPQVSAWQQQRVDQHVAQHLAPSFKVSACHWGAALPHAGHFALPRASLAPCTTPRNPRGPAGDPVLRGPFRAPPSPFPPPPALTQTVLGATHPEFAPRPRESRRGRRFSQCGPSALHRRGRPPRDTAGDPRRRTRSPGPPRRRGRPRRRTSGRRNGSRRAQGGTLSTSACGTASSTSSAWSTTATTRGTWSTAGTSSSSKWCGAPAPAPRPTDRPPPAPRPGRPPTPAPGCPPAGGHGLRRDRRDGGGAGADRDDHQVPGEREGLPSAPGRRRPVGPAPPPP